MFIRSPYNYDTSEASDVSAVACLEDSSQAQQHFKDQCDINRMVKTYAQTGLINQTTRMPLPEDFVGVTDYHTAMNAVRRGEEAFNGLPATVRERFDNDPGKFVDFCLDPANLNDAVALGLTREGVSQSEISSTSPTAQRVPEGDAQ